MLLGSAVLLLCDDVEADAAAAMVAAALPLPPPPKATDLPPPMAASGADVASAAVFELLAGLAACVAMLAVVIVTLGSKVAGIAVRFVMLCVEDDNDWDVDCGFGYGWDDVGWGMDIASG